MTINRDRQTDFLSQQSVEDMAPMRTVELPDIWVAHHRVSRRTGQSVPAYYYNLRSGKRFRSKYGFYRFCRRVFLSNGGSMRQEWLNRETAEQERGHICSRCLEPGHNCMTCPYPMIYDVNPYGSRRIRRCSRCLRPGHDIRTCDHEAA